MAFVFDKMKCSKWKGREKVGKTDVKQHIWEQLKAKEKEKGKKDKEEKRKNSLKSTRRQNKAAAGGDTLGWRHECSSHIHHF